MRKVWWIIDALVVIGLLGSWDRNRRTQHQLYETLGCPYDNRSEACRALERNR